MSVSPYQGASHILAYADYGRGPLRPADRFCNLKRGRAPTPTNVHTHDNSGDTWQGGVV